jgi:hypothetical protein
MHSFIKILGVCNLAFCVALSACSSDDDDGAGLGSTGSGASSSSGGKGGSSASGGSTSGSSSSGGSSSSSGGTNSSSGGSGNTGNTGNTGNIPTEACAGLPFENEGGAGGEAEACTGVGYEAEAIPVDMFIMMDRSVSMSYELPSGQTRWEALKDAVQEFVGADSARDIGAGIGFFSLSGIGNDSADCNADDYADPVVPIAPLGDVGEDLVAAIEDTTPGGLTPTVPALEGAISYAKGWAEDHPGRATIVVLVTDGYPTQCSSAPEEVSNAAKAGAEEAPYVRTYVIGVGDVAKFNLDAYARAGGSQKAFLTDDDNVSSAFVDALLNITNSKLACEYQIPEVDDNMQVDPEKVQVVYTPATGDAEEVPRLSGLGDCAEAENGGWYYDNAKSPTKITVCPCTCSRFAAGNVAVRIGCKPRIGIR